MQLRPYKYASPFIIFLAAWVSFHSTGINTFLPVVYAFGFIPFLELLMKPNNQNLSEAEEMLTKADRTYDFLLYLIVPLQYFFLILFLNSLQQTQLSWTDRIGRTMSMGLLCGVFGINVAHELGHRVSKSEQFMAKALLLTSQYIHFFIEHNKGHHKNVATREDPSSARFNESIFSFYPRTIFFSYISAWKIANSELKKKGFPVISVQNEMIQAQIVQLIFILLIGVIWGWQILLWYIISSLVGILLLECVNYIEHYGLTREKSTSGTYERTKPQHSWNSNHVIGRLMLFELSRHSDHHYMASRKYQVLRHHEQAPQMPTGYPGMMLLANIPPLWFRIMNRRVSQIAVTYPS